MADDTSSSNSASQGGSRGGQRPAGGREPGGFRIRLSDNEMRAARAVQEAFRLRSTVAALGFSIRTVAQLLEEGKLDELLAEQRAQAGPRPERGGERRGAGGRSDRPSAPRIDPFARPSRPTPAAAPVEELAPAAGDDTAALAEAPEEEIPGDLPAGSAAAEADAAETATASAVSSEA